MKHTRPASLHPKVTCPGLAFHDHDGPKGSQKWTPHYNQIATFTMTSSSINLPAPPPFNENDVLIGRQKFCRDNGGNQWLRNLVEGRFEEHDAADANCDYLDVGLKKSKFDIKREIVASIKSRGGRFLKKNKSGAWVEVSSDDASVQKVGDEFKRIRRNLRPEHCKAKKEPEALTGNHAEEKTASAVDSLAHSITADSFGTVFKRERDHDVASPARIYGFTLPPLPQELPSDSFRTEFDRDDDNRASPTTTNACTFPPLPQELHSDLSSLSLPELQRRKRDLKQQLKQYERTFEQQHGRRPDKAERGPTYWYERYKVLKSQISKREQQGSTSGFQQHIITGPDPNLESLARQAAQGGDVTKMEDDMENPDPTFAAYSPSPSLVSLVCGTTQTAGTATSMDARPPGEHTSVEDFSVSIASSVSERPMSIEGHLSNVSISHEGGCTVATNKDSRYTVLLTPVTGIICSEQEGASPSWILGMGHPSSRFGTPLSTPRLNPQKAQALKIWVRCVPTERGPRCSSMCTSKNMPDRSLLSSSDGL